MSLYDDLGVGAHATEDEIKAAYRYAAKTTHPDGGGSAEAFERVQASYQVLSDAARRDHYDMTGKVDDGAIPTEEQLAQVMLAQIALDLVAGEADLIKTDVILLIVALLQRRKKAHLNDIVRIEGKQARTQALRSRLKSASKDVLFEPVLEQQTRRFETELKKELQVLRIVGTAIELANEYSYMFDSKPLLLKGTISPELAERINIDLSSSI